MTALGRAQQFKEPAVADAAAASAVVNRFMQVLSGKRASRVVIVPELELPGVLVVLGTMPSVRIEADVQRLLRVMELEPGPMTAVQVELVRACCFLAEAVFEPDANDPRVPSTTRLGSMDEWGELTKEAIAEVWMQYSELCEANDPAAGKLTQADWLAITDAIQKKRPTELTYFGARKLTAYLLTTADQPASSPEPKSGSGPESSEP